MKKLFTALLLSLCCMVAFSQTIAPTKGRIKFMNVSFDQPVGFMANALIHHGFTKADGSYTFTGKYDGTDASIFLAEHKNGGITMLSVERYYKTHNEALAKYKSLVTSLKGKYKMNMASDRIDNYYAAGFDYDKAGSSITLFVYDNADQAGRYKVETLYLDGYNYSNK